MEQLIQASNVCVESRMAKNTIRNPIEALAKISIIIAVFDKVLTFMACPEGLALKFMVHH